MSISNFQVNDPKTLMSEGEIDSVPAYAGNVGMTAEIQLCKQLRSFGLRNVADHHIAGEPVVDSEYAGPERLFIDPNGRKGK